MTSAQFRKIALSLAGTSEHAHHGHPDFRAQKKVFATLGYPDENFAMVKLTPEQQSEFIAAHPEALAPVKGAWGLKGATRVRLAKTDAETAGAALTAAWRNVQPKGRPAKS